ncbi:MAG: flagellar biosynthesis protein FlhA [Oscillospiraceae bacterium]|nr:flagellar biosynthesis protein FlhA [Oscillospiraceae bacterium]
MKRLTNILGKSTAVFVVMIVLLFIISVPSVLLDFLFIVQLGLSMIILLMAMYIKEPLEFSAFPALLLLMTVFRLGLNISSTRSILMNKGNAGQVIKVFGSLVIKDNVIVGLVIFLIIVLVQFLVITKGAERIAEVSARFTLDALPGKQMAIDSDLNNGAIDEQEAAALRLKIQRESAFFGAMDGASKFVKGDAVISLIVTFVNLIGGICIGKLSGSGSFSQIISTYSTATVGDGLVSQIPALLTSVSAGIIITRKTAKEDLGTDLAVQFSSQPISFIIAGSVLLILLFAGFPPVQILIVSSLLIAAGIYKLSVHKKNADDTDETQETRPSVQNTDDSAADLYRLLDIEHMNIDFGYGLISMIEDENAQKMLEQIAAVRKQYAHELGIIIPAVKLNDSKEIGFDQYRICIKGEEIVSGEISDGRLLVLSDNLSDINIQGTYVKDPVFGADAKWIDEEKRCEAELKGYTVVDPCSLIITHLCEVISNHAYEILTRTEVYRMIDNLRKNNEALVDDVIPSLVTVGDLHKVLSGLLKENIPVRDLETILSTLSDCAKQTKNIDDMTERVRTSLKRVISHKYAKRNMMDVIGLDPDTENKILSCVVKNNEGTYIDLSRSDLHSLILSAGNEIKKAAEQTGSAVILTSPKVRLMLKRLLERYYPDAVVLSLSEIDSQVHVKSLGNITIS